MLALSTCIVWFPMWFRTYSWKREHCHENKFFYCISLYIIICCRNVWFYWLLLPGVFV